MANQCGHYLLVGIDYRNGNSDHSANELFLILADHSFTQSIKFSVKRLPIRNGLWCHLGKDEPVQ